MAYQNALVETLKWAWDEHKEWQIITADTDEDGDFKIALAHPGFYILLARLNVEGVPARTGKRWHGVVINRILTVQSKPTSR